MILPVLRDGAIVLIRNYRFAVGEHLWELPAGMLEQGEDPAVCASRELAEETGYTAGSIEKLGVFYTGPGTTDESMQRLPGHRSDRRAAEPGNLRGDRGRGLSRGQGPPDDIRRDHPRRQDHRGHGAVLAAEGRVMGLHDRPYWKDDQPAGFGGGPGGARGGYLPRNAAAPRRRSSGC